MRRFVVLAGSSLAFVWAPGCGGPNEDDGQGGNQAERIAVTIDGRTVECDQGVVDEVSDGYCRSSATDCSDGYNYSIACEFNGTGESRCFCESEVGDRLLEQDLGTFSGDPCPDRGVVFAACTRYPDDSQGDGDGDENPYPGLPTGPGWSVDAFCEEWAERAVAWCSWGESCCVESSDLRDRIIGGCDAATKEDCLAQMNLELVVNERGWDGTHAEACLDAGVGSRVPVACDGAHAGEALLRPLGISAYDLPLVAECRSLLEIPAGAPCGDLTGGPCPPGEEGDSCDSDVECSSGFWCRGASTFDPGACEPVARLGQDCASTPCQQGTYCEAGVCVAAHLAGSCDSDAECLGLCVDSTCTTACGGPYD